MSYVLRSKGADYYGKPMWFKQMTGIGPMTTIDPAQRAVFETREDAAMSKATRHTLSAFEIEEIPDAHGPR